VHACADENDEELPSIIIVPSCSQRLSIDTASPNPIQSSNYYEQIYMEDPVLKMHLKQEICRLQDELDALKELLA
jgi:hypothetical protein